MTTVDVRGVICPDDYAWFYEWMGMECTCPQKIHDAIENARENNNEELVVDINSPGGEIASGSAIYTMLREYDNVRIKITGQACSAASVIAMAGYCEMSPTALMMVHCVSTSVDGNHNDMEKVAEMLKEADRALCTAYMEKSGMSEVEALNMMENETWLTASKAKELGLIDTVMFVEDAIDATAMVAGLFGLPSKEELDRAREQKALLDSFMRDGLTLDIEKAQKRYKSLLEKEV